MVQFVNMLSSTISCLSSWVGRAKGEEGEEGEEGSTALDNTKADSVSALHASARHHMETLGMLCCTRALPL